MEIDLAKQENTLRLIGNKLKNKVNCFVIGGSAMLYYNAKSTTKDIDVVFDKPQERKEFAEVLYDMRYTSINPKFLYFNKPNQPAMMQLGEYRFDLFLKKIVHFWLTDSIKSRIRKVIEYENLIVHVVSPEDIILLKCATERAGDRSDALSLINIFRINWDVIIDEANVQTSLGKRIVAVSLYDFLLELFVDFKADIPKHVIKVVEKIGLAQMDKIIRQK